MNKVNYYRLSNGVRVMEVPHPGVESVTNLVLVKTGSRNEIEVQAGISHILEHMVFKGTEKYPTALDLATVVDSCGAEFNAFTGKEYTGYYIKSASEHQEKALGVLSEMLVKPKLRQSDWDREMGVIIEEINMYEDLPMERASEEFENLLYGGNLGRLIIGNKASVSGVKASDLEAYMDRWYRGANVMIVVVGKLGDDTKEILEREFGKLGSGEILEYEEQGAYGDEREFRLDKETEQVHFVVGVPGIKMDDERRYALGLAQVILGGNMSSRLFTEVREKRGWAYYVKAQAERYYDVGHLSVRAGVKKDVKDEAIELVIGEMMKLPKDVSAEELRKAKDYYKGVFTLQMENPMGVAKYLGEWALMKDEVKDPMEGLKKVQEVELDEVRSVLEELVKRDEFRRVVVE